MTFFDRFRRNVALVVLSTKKSCCSSHNHAMHSTALRSAWNWTSENTAASCTKHPLWEALEPCHHMLTWWSEEGAPSDVDDAPYLLASGVMTTQHSASICVIFIAFTHFNFRFLCADFQSFLEPFFLFRRRNTLTREARSTVHVSEEAPLLVGSFRCCTAQAWSVMNCKPQCVYRARILH